MMMLALGLVTQAGKGGGIRRGVRGHEGVVMSHRSLLAMGDGPQNNATIVGDEPLRVSPQGPQRLAMTKLQ